MENNELTDVEQKNVEAKNDELQHNEVEKVAEQYEEVSIKKKVVRTDSYFDGSLIELIGYRILAILITLFTFTLASAWAEKILISYKIEHTVYNGKRLKFEGTGASLFVQRFKWGLLTLITFGIYALWIPLKKEKWVVSHTHFEDEEFIKGDSYFNGGLLGLIGVNIFTNFLTFMSFGLLYPFVICYKQKWFAKHTIISRKKLIFKGTSISLVGHYFLWWFLSLITFGIFSLWLPIKIMQWKAKNTYIKLKDEQEEKTSKIPMIIAVVLIVVVVVLIGSYFSNVVKNFDEIDSYEDLFSNIKIGNLSDKSDYTGPTVVSGINGSSDSDSVGSVTSNNNPGSYGNYSQSDFHRDTYLKLIDAQACYGMSSDADLIARIENGGNISLSQNLGAILLEGTNAKYLYVVRKIAVDNVDLYYITNNNELYVIKNPNASNYNQAKQKVTNKKVVEFLGIDERNNGEYLKVLCQDGSVEYILYLEYPN